MDAVAFISGTDLCGWLGLSTSTLITRLAAVANQAVTDYLDNADAADLVANAVCIQAALETGANLYRNKGINPLVASMALGDGSVTFRDAGAFEPIPATAKAMLAPYRRFHLASSC